jgi:anti-sigma-K factor RskA
MMTEDREILAAEYVVGTLDQHERAQAERLVVSDAEFAAAVRAWERRLGELNATVEPVEPPAAIWSAIRAGIDRARPAGRAEIIDLTARMQRWRTATYIASALAATLLLFVAVREFYPGARPSEGGRFVAVLQRDAVSPGFLLTVDVKTRSFTTVVPTPRIVSPENSTPSASM